MYRVCELFWFPPRHVSHNQLGAEEVRFARGWIKAAEGERGMQSRFVQVRFNTRPEPDASSSP